MECVEQGLGLTLPAATADNLTPTAAAVRGTLLGGLATVDDFAAGLGRSTRTVREWMAMRKLPVVYVGNTPYIPITKARDALLKQGKRNTLPRKPGRPRKAA